jgi:gluconolactonase
MSATETDSFVAHDSRFADVLGSAPRLERVAELDAHEGPVYVPAEDALYLTTVRTERVAIKRLALRDGSVSVVVPDANTANGMTLDREGRLVVCEQGTRETPACISRLDLRTGERETVVDAYDGRPFNSPNDVVVSSDGAVWFTDPSYGFLQGFRPVPQLPDAVYRHDPATGETRLVADGFDKPNGLAFSADERTLYVSDNGEPHHLLAYPVADGHLEAPTRLAVGTPGHPDGLKVDAAGRIYASASSGVQVFHPAGDLLGALRLPGTVTFCFGGPARNVLYLTTDTAVWAAVLNAKGA